MKNIILLLFSVATYAAGSNAFSLTKSEPNPTLIVKEGGSFELNCEVDNYYEYCKFIHNGNICDFGWKRDVWNITVLDCADYADRMVWTGNYDYYKCAITITDAKSDDAGTWSCELESYAAGKFRGYGYNVTSEFNVDVIATTNTTTNTETKPAAKATTLKFLTEEEKDVINVDSIEEINAFTKKEYGLLKNAIIKGLLNLNYLTEKLGSSEQKTYYKNLTNDIEKNFDV